MNKTTMSRPCFTKKDTTAYVEGGKPKAVIIEGGSMAKHVRPTQLEKNTVIRHVARKWPRVHPSSAHVKSLSRTDGGVSIFSSSTSGGLTSGSCIKKNKKKKKKK